MIYQITYNNNNKENETGLETQYLPPSKSHKLYLLDQAVVNTG